jgi:two-component system chemotaxis response regulator CheY
MALIMVVENSASVRKLICFNLEQAGHKAVEAENGVDALNKLKGMSPDMMFTDLNMPQMNGLELTRQLRTQPRFKYLPIVFVTTEFEDAKKQEARAAGATAWITKPFQAEQILKVVKKVLG